MTAPRAPHLPAFLAAALVAAWLLHPTVTAPAQADDDRLGDVGELPGGGAEIPADGGGIEDLSAVNRLGDADHDGDVDGDDAALMQAGLLGLADPFEVGVLARVDGDDDLDVRDLLHVAQAAAGRRVLDEGRRRLEFATPSTQVTRSGADPVFLIWGVFADAPGGAEKTDGLRVRLDLLPPGLESTLSQAGVGGVGGATAVAGFGVIGELTPVNTTGANQLATVRLVIPLHDSEGELLTELTSPTSVLVQPSVCGNGLAEPGEACDDGNTRDCDGCRGDCNAVETGCGDGFVCGFEACDDGADNGTCGHCNEGCWADFNVCGDGVVACGEACDDGWADACGSCNDDCSGPGTGATCGDGERCPELERCDDGFTDDCGSCNADCSRLGAGATCGDGERCEELEACDDGFADVCGTCNADCTAAGDGLGACGDGALCPEAGEACDDGNDATGDGCSAACVDEGGACSPRLLDLPAGIPGSLIHLAGRHPMALDGDRLTVLEDDSFFNDVRSTVQAFRLGAPGEVAVDGPALWLPITDVAEVQRAGDRLVLLTNGNVQVWTFEANGTRVAFGGETGSSGIGAFEVSGEWLWAATDADLFHLPLSAPRISAGGGQAQVVLASAPLALAARDDEVAVILEGGTVVRVRAEAGALVDAGSVVVPGASGVAWRGDRLAVTLDGGGLAALSSEAGGAFVVTGITDTPALLPHPVIVGDVAYAPLVEPEAARSVLAGDLSGGRAPRILDLQLHFGDDATTRLLASEDRLVAAARHELADAVDLPGSCQATCGNGTKEWPEACDDGNHAHDDDCTADCSRAPRCGDGVVDAAHGEACDDGFNSACGACNADCSGPGTGAGTCGDGALCPDDDEVCDDGFNDACGTCNADCTAPGSGPGACGDGIVCAEAGEACDDGHTSDCGACNADCSDVGRGDGSNFCGDGDTCTEAGEVCDDGFADACGTCNADCTAPGSGPGECGDGQWCPESGEACDDGNLDVFDGCSAACLEEGGGCFFEEVANAPATGLRLVAAMEQGVLVVGDDPSGGPGELLQWAPRGALGDLALQPLAPSATLSGVRDAQRFAAHTVLLREDAGDSLFESWLISKDGKVDRGASMKLAGVPTAWARAGSLMGVARDTSLTVFKVDGDGRFGAAGTAPLKQAASRLAMSEQAIAAVTDRVEHFDIPGGGVVRATGSYAPRATVSALAIVGPWLLVATEDVGLAVIERATMRVKGQPDLFEPLAEIAPDGALLHLLGQYGQLQSVHADALPALEEAGFAYVPTSGLPFDYDIDGDLTWVVTSFTGLSAYANLPGHCPSVCGDSSVDHPEVCDDGNRDDGDGCASDCLSESVCGDGIVDERNGEVCDDGDDTDCGPCAGDCRGEGVGLGTCGDGVVCQAAGEACDDGYNDPCGSCNADCSGPGSGPGVCGDGLVCPESGEECDDGGDGDACDGCTPTCLRTASLCGNGQRECDEGCDDGNHEVGDGCSSVCLPEEASPCVPEVVGGHGGRLGRLAREGNVLYRTVAERGVEALDIADRSTARLLSRVAVGGVAYDILPAGDDLFVAAGPVGLGVIDTSDPSNLEAITTAPVVAPRGADADGDVTRLARLGDHLYGVVQFDGVAIFDVGAPRAPVGVGFVATGAGARDVAAFDGHLWVADSEEGMRGFSLADPAAPEPISRVTLPGPALDFDRIGDILFVGSSQSGLVLVDVSDPNEPAVAGVAERTLVGQQFGISYFSQGAQVLGDQIWMWDAIGAGVARFFVQEGICSDNGADCDLRDGTDGCGGARCNPRPRSRPSVASGATHAVADGVGAYVASLSGGLVRISDVNADDLDVTPLERQSVDPVAMVADAGVLYLGDRDLGLVVLAPDVDDGLAFVGHASRSSQANWQGVEHLVPHGTVVYGLNDNGLEVYDVDDFAAPSRLAVLDRDREFRTLLRSGDRLLATSTFGSAIYDVSQPRQPLRLAAHVAIDYPDRVYRLDDAVWMNVNVGAGRTCRHVLGLEEFDVLQSTCGLEFGSSPSPLRHAALRVQGHQGPLAVATIGGGGANNHADLITLDVSDPLRPTVLGELSNITLRYNGQVRVDSGYALVFDEDEGVRVVDLSAPSQPAEIGTYAVPGSRPIDGVRLGDDWYLRSATSVARVRGLPPGCIPPCGNAVVEPGERCDDGNNASGDGCSADCRSDETCGNSVLDRSAGEDCDDGNTASFDGCSAACLTE